MDKLMSRHHFVNLLGWATIAASVIMIVTVASWMLLPTPTIEFKNSSGQMVHFTDRDDVDTVYTTNKTSYKQNENGSYSVTFCKYTDIVPTLTKKFEDGIQFTAEDTRAVLEKGCGTTIVPLHIPETLPPGKYRLAIYLSYKINPMRTDDIENFSNWFTVLSDGGVDIETQQ